MADWLDRLDRGEPVLAPTRRVVLGEWGDWRPDVVVTVALPEELDAPGGLSCLTCGGDLPPASPTGRRARYCSPECRPSSYRQKHGA
jgi:hypothetical protein